MDEKIAKLYQNLKHEGVDDVRANDIIQKIKEYYEYLSNYNLEQLDYIGALKAIQYGRFLKSNNAGGDNAKVWNNTKVYSDNDVVIWKPRNYQESSIIGSPQWCISFRDYHWNNHVIHNGETIYMIYNGWANEDLQYTSACVERNGNIIIYDCNHNKLSDIDKDSFLKSLGDGASVLKPQVNVENKQYNTNRNMNRKLIRLTESDLHRIVKESVNRVLKEVRYDFENQAYDEKYDGENTYLQVAMMGSPESYVKCNGRKPTNDYIRAYNILSSNPPEKVLDLWRKCAYESNVARNMADERQFIVEEDADGIYLMIRVDNKEDFRRYQSGNW